MWSIWAYMQVKLLVPLIEVLQVGIIMVTSLIFSQEYIKNASVFDGESFDYIIVGAGTAGCVVANRLTELENWSVLLIEAGDDPPYSAQIPGLSVLLSAKFPDWGYETVDDKYASQALKNKNVHLIQGKMLGGSSNVNYMYYIRGNKEDYNNWSAQGNKGWDWNSVLKYFKKSENLNASYLLNSESSSLHAANGYMGITTPRWERETKNIFEAFKENGRDVIEDINGFQQLGYSVPSYNINNGQRQGGTFAFIKPILKRKNLHIVKGTTTIKIILDNNKAVGVTVKSDGTVKDIFAKREVIISAGSTNSPKLLMLSGIGPKEHLEELGIEPKVNLPNVGRNMQDHMIVPIIISGGNSTGFKDNLEAINHLDTFPVPTIMGYVALDKNQTYPDYQVTSFSLAYGSVFPTLMCSEIFKWNDEICTAMANSTNRDTFFALITFLHPESRGTIKLRSKNPDDVPLIYTQYFSNNNDVNKFAECVKDFVSVVDTTYFRNAAAHNVDFKVKQCSDLEFESQEYWECFVLNMASTQFHLSGTCAMGKEGGVVDERLRVKGVKKLRIVDASVMPTIVSGNINAAVVMIAEKASDMIKNDNYVTRVGQFKELTHSSDYCDKRYEYCETY